MTVHVLVVDDEPSYGAFVQDVLAQPGRSRYTVEYAATYTDGLRRLSDGDVDVGLIDYRLGSASGIDLVRHALAGGCRAPLIMLTGHGGDAIDQAALSAGAAEYLDKSDLTPALLERTIRYAINVHELAREQQRDAFFRALIEHNCDAIIVMNADGVITYASESFSRVSGVSPVDIVGANAFGRIHANDHLASQAMLRALLDQPKEPVRLEYRSQLPDGSWRDRELVAVNRISDPAVQGIVANYRDITERKQADATRAHLAAIVESSCDAIFSRTPDGIVRSWNLGAESLFGYAHQEMVGSTMDIVTPSEDREDAQLLDRARCGEQIQNYDAVRVRKDGTAVDVSLTLSPIVDAAGDVVGVSTMAHDISVRMRALEEVRRTHERLRAVVSAVPILLWALDLDGLVTLSEGRLLAKAGVKPGQLVGQSQLDLHKDNAVELEMTRRALAGESLHYTAEIGGVVYETWYSPIHAADGTLGGTIGVAIDVTERMRVDEELRQTQKMEAIGHLAGGVAHDFNNLLTAITGYSELALESDRSAQDARSDVREILNAAHMAAALTRQLLGFSRRQVVQFDTLDLNVIVRRIDGLLHRLIGDDVELRTELAPALEYVRADAGQIEQVLMNLALNARDAMPAGGRLTVATRVVSVDDAFVVQHHGATAGPHVMLSVTDTGVGMTETVRRRIFEPFFTTKEQGKGTGLGLSTVYGIVKHSGGSVWVTSEPGRGTTFTVYLPVVASPSARAKAVAGAKVLEGTETVLIAEDQALVRAITRTTLQRHGYVVLEAAHPRDALAISRSEDRTIDLLLTDVVMPGMSGLELARTLRAERPTMRVLFTSGYTSDATVDAGETDAEFIQKPFTPRALLEKVRLVLDARDRRVSS
jgi:two-component system cell cycle sensor histidine kinase/response regulator CckA